MTVALVGVLVSAAAGVVVATGPAGSPDPSFGGDGLITSTAMQGAYRIVRLADGKLLTVGYGQPSGFALARFNADGNPDTSFGSNGFVNTPPSAFGLNQGGVFGRVMVVQPDDKIVVGGYATYVTCGWLCSYSYWFAVARYQPDGRLDDSFGSGGTSLVSSPIDPQVAGIGLQSTGKIVMNVGSFQGGEPPGSVMRFRASGGLDTRRYDPVTGAIIDPGFGPNGTGFSERATNMNYTLGFLILPDDRIVLTGGGSGMARFTAEGALDPTFGSGGMATLPHGGQALARLSDGKLLVAGNIGGEGNNAQLTVSRHAANGPVDTSFGTDGMATVTFGRSIVGRAIRLQSDGKIVVNAGIILESNLARFGAVRLNANGSPDTSYGTGGVAVAEFPELSNQYYAGDGYGLALQPDDKAVISGAFNQGMSQAIGIVRLTAVGAPIPRVPEAPASVGATAGDRSVTVTWTPPASDGGSPVTGYVVTGAPGNLSRTLGPDARQTTFTGLTNGTTYTFGVAATNAVGTGPAATATGTPVQPTRRTAYDVNGDRKADAGIFRPSNAQGPLWYVPWTGGGGQLQIYFGQQGDLPVMADYDGDGGADATIWRPSTGLWYGVSQAGVRVVQQAWGQAGDIPVPCDYDGDGRADLVVYREGTYLGPLSAGGFFNQARGARGDTPVYGDVNKDGTCDAGIFRPTNQQGPLWYVPWTGGGGQLQIYFGQQGDTPVMADYDGDGAADAVIWRPTSGLWYGVNQAGAQVVQQVWGQNGDVPVPADYDGDGKADLITYRGGTFLGPQTGGAFLNVSRGISGDTPVNKGQP